MDKSLMKKMTMIKKNDNFHITNRQNIIYVRYTLLYQ